jgi:two-component system sensor histidine kinase AlgZ
MMPQRLRALCSPSASYWVRVGVVSIASAVVVTLLLGSMGRGGPSLTGFLYCLVYAVSLGGLAGWTMPRALRKLAPRGSPQRWPVVIAILLALAAVGTLVGRLIITLVFVPREGFWGSLGADLRIAALVVVGIGISMTFYESLRGRLDMTTAELRIRELEHERAQKLALEARLSSLESRLQPHFLFNTLNAISALIQEDPDRAERTVERLAALLRFSLDATERRTVSLADELKIVVDYLEIEKARFGERLTYSLDVDADVRAWEVLPLSVQTLVENSVKHAIAPRRGGGHIHVQARRAGDRLAVGVRDEGPGFSLDAIVPGHGLDNLRDRLAVRFGSQAALAVASADGATLVTLSHPKT